MCESVIYSRKAYTVFSITERVHSGIWDSMLAKVLGFVLFYLSSSALAFYASSDVIELSEAEFKKQVCLRIASFIHPLILKPRF